jgi:hypothetical protein
MDTGRSSLDLSSAKLELPLGLLKRRVGIALASFGVLVGTRAAQTLNNPPLVWAWGALSFWVLWSTFGIKTPRVLRWILPGVLAVAAGWLLARENEAVFLFLDRNLSVFPEAGVLANWILLALLLNGASLLGEILAHLPIDGAHAFRALPLGTLILLMAHARWAG